MPFETGGLADKLGNRYEGRWIATKLLSLLNEKILSVTVEAIGGDEQGVDIWIVQKNGVRQAHQCKARNGSKGYWSIDDLASRGVLGNLKYQLDRNPAHEFFFVSSVGSEDFQSICNFARRSDNNSELFFREKIQHSRNIQKCFEKFCNHLSLNPDEEFDRAQAFQYLKQTYIVLHPDDQDTLQNLLDLTDSLLLGEPKIVVSALITYVENNDRFGSPIYVDELREFLSKNDIYPKRLEHDSRIASAVEVLQLEFTESIRPLLIGGAPIPRSETSVLIDAINNGQNVILSGAAGYGKSSVLFELTEYLQQERIPYLPIRLDRREPENTAAQFGRQMGLPDCPAFSLSALAGERPSVLILDQLDAIRWTSAHSNNALDVCKELEHHVQLKRLYGEKILIVLCSRTFDLRHDPSIRNWLAGNRAKEFVNIEVRELPSEDVKRIVGPPFLQMTQKEQRLLANPLNLSIWVELSHAGTVPQFRSATDLMREFWKNRRLVLHEQANITPDQVDQVLMPLIDYMEKNGKISTPERIIANWPKNSQALYSYGILQQSAGKISFCHQRYLDYLIANRLLEQIDAGTGSILEWLGAKEKQSLFRREQLRQALAMLSEESPSRFLATAKELLAAPEIRFHIKHLILELIGSLEEISEELRNYCLTLYEDDSWKEHILETVFIGHPPHVIYLNDRGIIEQWLESESEGTINHALWLLRSVADKIPDLVAMVLEPYLEKGVVWLKRINSTLPWNIEEDSDHIFQIRLKLARQGEYPSLIDWKALCSKHSFRAVQLIEAVLSTWKINDDEAKDTQKTRIEKWYDKDAEAINRVVNDFPKETWDLLLPHIERLTRFDIKPYDSYQEKWIEHRYREDRIIEFARGVVELSMLAGKKLATEFPKELLQRTQLLESSTSPVIQEILVEAYRCFPPEYADQGVSWLLANTDCFRLGSSFNEPEWQPAVRLVESLSPYCSEGLFQRLERAIINYHAPNEKRNAEYCLRAWKTGYFDHYWGYAQYFLLPALQASRVQPSTAALIRVLQRKFGGYPEERFLRGGRSRGGWVGSKLDPNLEKISDRAWLGIIKNSKVKNPKNREWIQVSPDQVLETSVRQFSGSLRTVAKRYPERFARLSLLFPDDVDPAYISGILEGCGQKAPDSTLPEQVRTSWEPAKVTTVEAVLEKFQTTTDQMTADSFCRIITERHEEIWSEATLARLVHYAQTHPDPEPGKLHINCDKSADEASVDMLLQNTINCVRGNAARAIQLLLWEHPDLLEKLRPAIEALVRDHHPAVRMAATEMLLPVLNIDKDQAVEWFVLACEKDPRVAASPRGIRFYNYTIPSHIERLAPIIQQMVLSPWDDVAKEGARQATARWLYNGFFKEEFVACQSGTVPQRQGVADVAVQLLHDRALSDACQKILRPLLNDPDKEVRNRLPRFFHNPDCLIDETLKSFILEYINSLSFSDNPDILIWKMKDYTGSIIFLADTLFRVCDIFSSTLKTKSREISSGLPLTISDTVSLLLRLYEIAFVAENTEITNRCLDIWDLLFQNRVGVVRDLTKAIE